MDRANTINSLALAMGVVSENDLVSKRYNVSTGTLYCGDEAGRTLDEEVVKNAITYFENMKKKYERSGMPNMEKVVSYFDAALVALNEMQAM